MNKAELIDVLTKKLDADRRTATDAVEHFVDTIVRAVHKGDSVTITGFGVFEQRRRAARVARNPRTGETVKVKPTSVPAFRPGAQFKAVISGAQRLPAEGPAVKRGGVGTARKAVKRAAVKKAVKRAAVKKAVKRAAVKKAVKRAAVKKAVKRSAAKKAGEARCRQEDGEARSRQENGEARSRQEGSEAWRRQEGSEAQRGQEGSAQGAGEEGSSVVSNQMRRGSSRPTAYLCLATAVISWRPADFRYGRPPPDGPATMTSPRCCPCGCGTCPDARRRVRTTTRSDRV